MGRSNYLGSAGYIGHANLPLSGSFIYGDQRSVANFPDGTSNRMMFGEYGGGFIAWGGSGGIQDGLDGAAWSCTALPTGFGTPCSRPDYANGANGPVGGGNPCWSRYGSFHTGNITQITWADGHATPVSNAIDFSTWVYVSGYGNGVVTNPP
jgi:prepilin-type processing-associated H-X9-DG protein